LIISSDYIRVHARIRVHVHNAFSFSVFKVSEVKYFDNLTLKIAYFKENTSTSTFLLSQSKCALCLSLSVCLSVFLTRKVKMIPFLWEKFHNATSASFVGGKVVALCVVVRMLGTRIPSMLVLFTPPPPGGVMPLRLYSFGDVYRVAVLLPSNTPPSCGVTACPF
jgi:hypothetical protein